MSDVGFREFMEVHYAALLRTAFLLTGSTHAAEDLLQSALLRAYGRWDKIDEPMAYLRMVMVNLRTSTWRRLKNELITGFLPDKPKADFTSSSNEKAVLMAALAKLPVRMRAVLVLRYWEDMSEVETAKALGCSVGSVKSQASRGLARMREVLNPAGDRPMPTKEVTA